MDYNLGLWGLGLLVLMSVGFGLIAQLVIGISRTRWASLVAGAAFFIGGLVASEVVFAWATIDDLQPIIDGLLFDEALLGGLVLGVATTIVTWLLVRQPGADLHRPALR
jgi:hypothetical protein